MKDLNSPAVVSLEKTGASIEEALDHLYEIDDEVNQNDLRSAMQTLKDEMVALGTNLHEYNLSLSERLSEASVRNSSLIESFKTIWLNQRGLVTIGSEIRSVYPTYLSLPSIKYFTTNHCAWIIACHEFIDTIETVLRAYQSAQTTGPLMREIVATVNERAKRCYTATPTFAANLRAAVKDLAKTEPTENKLYADLVYEHQLYSGLREQDYYRVLSRLIEVTKAFAKVEVPTACNELYVSSCLKEMFEEVVCQWHHLRDWSFIQDRIADDYAAISAKQIHLIKKRRYHG